MHEKPIDELLIGNKSSHIVIQRLQNRKRAWIDLTEDLLIVSSKLDKINLWIRMLPAERRNIQYINEMLNLQHQQSYLALLQGVENMLEYYLQDGRDEYFAKLLETRDLVCR